MIHILSLFFIILFIIPNSFGRYHRLTDTEVITTIDHPRQVTPTVLHASLPPTFMQTGKLHTRATIPDNSCGTVHTVYIELDSSRESFQLHLQGYDLWSGVYYVNISKINLYDENYTWMTLWTNSTSDLSSDWISISSSPFFQYEKTYYVEEIYNGECRLSFPTGLKFVFPKKQSIFAEYGFVIISCACAGALLFLLVVVVSICCCLRHHHKKHLPQSSQQPSNDTAQTVPFTAFTNSVEPFYPPPPSVPDASQPPQFLSPYNQPFVPPRSDFDAVLPPHVLPQPQYPPVSQQPSDPTQFVSTAHLQVGTHTDSVPVERTEGKISSFLMQSIRELKYQQEL